jgi:uncharacterized protein YkwD
MRNTVGGNSLAQATPISSSKEIKDRVNKQNRSDLFSFNLSNSSSFNLKFKSSGQGASVKLIQDRNQNGLIDAGEILKSAPMQAKDSSVKIPSLDTGTYFIQVSTTGSGNNNYRLALTSTTLSSSSASGGTSSGSTPSGGSTQPLSSLLQQVVTLTNDFRRQNGLADLTVNNKLNAAAQTHSQNMALQDFFAHEGKDGSEPWDRMTAAGYQWSKAAENIAAGYQTAADVVNGWINSPGHRANMLDASVKEIGVGYYFLANDTGTTNFNSYWTQDFGAPR